MPRGTSLYDEMRLQRRLEPEAQRYIEAIERAERQATESAVRVAINDFVAGCKADGIWRAIRACCILAGARSLTGALIPLVGPAPSNINLAPGSYARKTGLMGNGSNAYLNTNRNANADPQNNHHLSIYGTIQANWNIASRAAGTIVGSKAIIKGTGTVTQFASSPNTDTENAGPSTVALGALAFMGLSRSDAGSYTARAGGSDLTIMQNSGAPASQNIFVFAASNGGTPTLFTSSRLRFYSIGEALDLGRLDRRVSELMRRIETAIQ
jgi:hypothetical protein